MIGEDHVALRGQVADLLGQSARRPSRIGKAAPAGDRRKTKAATDEERPFGPTEQMKHERLGYCEERLAQNARVRLTMREGAETERAPISPVAGVEVIQCGNEHSCWRSRSAERRSCPSRRRRRKDICPGRPRPA